MFFATGRSTREWVASWAAKISEWISRLDLPLANKSPKLTSEDAAEARDLIYPRLSRQNRAKLYFWNFQIFPAKYFPKTPKTLKNLFVLELTKIEHVKTHFIKYNHTNEYGIYRIINLCVVCGYQKWNSPLSNVKLQWSIQPRHTQLALDHVTHLNYRCIYNLLQDLIT